MTRARRAWRGFAVAVAIFPCAASCSSGGFLTSLDGGPPGGDDGGSAAVMVDVQCQADLPVERAKYLESVRTCEDGDLSCPR